MSVSSVGVLFSIFIGLGILIWAVIIYFSKDEDEDIDNAIGINFMAGLSQGRAIGIEQDVIFGKDDRKVIDFSPRDVRIRDVNQITNTKVIIDKNKTITLPKGTWSRDKNINIYLPPSADKFPEPLKKTEFGKILMLWTALKDADNTELDAFKEGMKRQSAHIKAMGAGEISVERMTQIDELFQESLDAIKDSKKKDESGSSGFSPPRFGSSPSGG